VVRVAGVGELSWRQALIPDGVVPGRAAAVGPRARALCWISVFAWVVHRQRVPRGRQFCTQPCSTVLCQANLSVGLVYKSCAPEQTQEGGARRALIHAGSDLLRGVTFGRDACY